jgi:hypothetical protein
MDLGQIKLLYGKRVDELDDEELVDALFDEVERYRVHPDVLESLGKLKGGVDGGISLSRARKRKLIKLFEQRIEEATPTVKFVAPDPVQKKKKPKSDPNDIFTLDW